MNNSTWYSNQTIEYELSNVELQLITNILGFINFFFIVFGTFGNLISYMILIRKDVHKNSCMRYLATLCLLDIFCLYTWNLSLVYSLFTGRKIEHEGNVTCRLFSFFSYFILLYWLEKFSKKYYLFINFFVWVKFILNDLTVLFGFFFNSNLYISYFSVLFVFCC